MIDARAFVDAARDLGFTSYAGVPCSYLTPFINFVLQDPSLAYVSAANEGDAVALNAGLALAGGRGVTMMQNSGLGNAVSPLTSLTWTFRLPQLMIVTWRGQPGVPDEPQHALMGPITPSMLDTMEIAWELFPTELDAVRPALARAVAHMDESGRPYALLMQKGSVAPHELVGTTPTRRTPAAAMLQRVGGPSPTRRASLQRVVARTPLDTSVVFASTGFCGRELYALADRPNQLYMVGSMGCVSSLALGFALARPDLDVVALDGDGAALMRLGALATVGRYGGANFRHVVLDNGAHESTGGQATVSATVSFAGVAAACGYAQAIDADDLDALDALFDAPADGPALLALSIAPGTPADLPRPTVTPVDVAERFMRHAARRSTEHVA